MPNSKYERDFEVISSKLLFQGRFDPRLLQDKILEDGYPGLQRVMKNLISTLFDKYIVEGCTYDGSTLSTGIMLWVGIQTPINAQTISLSNGEYLYLDVNGIATKTSNESLATDNLLLYFRDSNGVLKDAKFSFSKNLLTIYEMVVSSVLTADTINTTNLGATKLVGNMDVNSKTITNLPAPSTANEPSRKTDLDNHALNITNHTTRNHNDLQNIGANDHHNKQHAITATADHTSTATSGQVLKANANGLPVDATNTDAQVSATVIASHAKSHAVTSTLDHTAGNWKVVYTNGSGQIIELALGADAKYLQGEGVGSAPTFGDLNIVDDSSPQLGGTLDLNEKGIISLYTAGENLVTGNLCYLKSDGKFWKADANAAATASSMLAIAIETINANNSGTFLIYGYYTTSGLTVGDNYWISAATTGTWVNTAGRPSGNADIIRYVGSAISATKFFFKPDSTWIELVV